MTFYADLHVHSRFSRATSRDTTFEHLAYWARRKGLSVVGTGDFTHPEWLDEIKRDLVPAGPGLFRLRDELDHPVLSRLPPPCRTPVRFMLQTEISTIYKKDERTRKVHHVVYAPDIDTVQRMNGALARIGNLASDGRPILGLDSRDLLEIVLEAGDGAYLVPAHIWTPWFSAMGSKSGFDGIAQCYRDLSSHIFAVETGLSSDPPMNWRLSSLDKYRLVSNSDAHSPGKLGREACVFNTDIDYFAMRRALQTGKGYMGTVEFFPEEGKYHLDGHRKCESRLEPAETRRNQGLCPVCGKPATVGVMHRVEELADRPQGARPANAAPFHSFIPLVEILGEILKVGPGSKRVRRAYDALTAALGSELHILEYADLADARRIGSSLLAEALDRMRRGRVIREAGYDGEYGVIRVFKPGELSPEDSTTLLFPDTPSPPQKEPSTISHEASLPSPSSSRIPHPASSASPIPHSAPRTAHSPFSPDLFGPLGRLDPDQRVAASTVKGPLLIIAGPGTGKTRTLTHRIAYLVQNQGVPPEKCLAITFTRRAARELRERLEQLVPGHVSRIPVETFHSLGYRMVREHAAELGLADSLRVPEDIGFDDLIRLPLELLEKNPALRRRYHQRYRWISVDEYQDIDELQYRLVRVLVPEHANICAIGDPDQAIYGFRGSDVRFFQRFEHDFPGTNVVQLKRNYRSSRAIVEAATQAIAPATLVHDRILRAVTERAARIVVHSAASDKAEAEFVVHTVERLVGGSGFFSMDSGRVESSEGESFGFSDFAVLYRTKAQAAPVREAFARSGMPFQQRAHTNLAEMPIVKKIITALTARHFRKPLTERLEDLVGKFAGERDPEGRAVLDVLWPMAETADSLDDFLSRIALGVDVDLWDQRADAVSLLTLHSAKGLEFPVVFMVGCEDGVLPLRWGRKDPDEDEERRLFFVGMTRARDRLYLCHAAKRRRRGKLQEMKRSPFIRPIESALIERSRTRKPPPRPAHEQMGLFGPAKGR